MENQQKRKPGRNTQSRNKLMRPFMKRLERRRGSQNSTTPTSPDCTSPDSPQVVPMKCPLYARLNEGSRPESTTMATQTSAKARRRHTRSNSGGSSRSPACSRTSSNRTTVVDSETQTDYNMDLSETDLSPGAYFAGRTLAGSFGKAPQRVLLHEPNLSDGENANSVRLMYLDSHSQEGMRYTTVCEL